MKKLIVLLLLVSSFPAFAGYYDAENAIAVSRLSKVPDILRIKLMEKQYTAQVAETCSLDNEVLKVKRISEREMEFSCGDRRVVSIKLLEKSGGEFNYYQYIGSFDNDQWRNIDVRFENCLGLGLKNSCRASFGLK